jgi:hypothetical protein
MRFFKDDLGIETAVEWYYVPETRPCLDYFSPFRSNDWILREDQPILGEVANTRSYFAGQVSDDVNGAGLCGSREQWEGGASILDPIRPLNPTTGQPCCCGPGSLPFKPDTVIELPDTLQLVPRAECTAAGDTAKYYRLQVATPTNKECFDCVNAGGNFTLVGQPPDGSGTCYWQSGLITVCGVQRLWELRSPFSGLNWQVYFYLPGFLSSLATYNVAGTFKPFGFNFFLKVSTDLGCNWPGAVAVQYLWNP